MIISEEIQKHVKERIYKKFKVKIYFGYTEFYESELNELLKDKILRGLIEPLEWYNNCKTEYVRERTEEKTGNTVYGLFSWFVKDNFEIFMKYSYDKDELYTLIATTLHEKYPEVLI